MPNCSWGLWHRPTSSEAYPVMVPHPDNYLFILSGRNLSRDGKLQNFSPAGLLLPLCCSCALLLIPHPYFHLCGQSSTDVSNPGECVGEDGQASGVRVKLLKCGVDGVGVWGESEVRTKGQACQAHAQEPNSRPPHHNSLPVYHEQKQKAKTAALCKIAAKPMISPSCSYNYTASEHTQAQDVISF